MMGQNAVNNGLALLVSLLLPAIPSGAIVYVLGLENPGLILGSFVILYVLVSVAIRVGQPVFNHFIERWSDNLLLALTPYKKQYLKYVAARCEYFDVKGISAQGPHTLELNKVFVNLSVASEAHRFTKDPIHVPDELVTGNHSIWEYVRNPNLRNLVILGPPGSGKTTLLRFMALTLCNRRSIRREEAPRKLPIILYVRNHADRITDNPDIALRNVVISTLKDINTPPEGWFEKHLHRGDFLIMLDGLDEIGDPGKRQRVVNWIQDQTEQYADCHFVISSRPGGYQNNPLANVSVLQVQPFNRDQQTQFVNNWYMATEMMAAQKDDLSVQLRAREGAEDLLNRINTTPALTSLAVNPLLLTMIASVHRFRSSLPGRRIELYVEICDVFLGKRRAAYGVEDDLTPAQKQRVLQPLAFAMMRDNLREIRAEQAATIIHEALQHVSGQSKPERFLKSIEDNSGLLIERENGEYSFSHLTFQEYLAAQYIEQQQQEETLHQSVDSGWWHETIRLYCARNDATAVIQACIDVADVESLTLAAQCLEEALEVDPVVKEQVREIVEDWANSTDNAKRRTAGEVLLKLRLDSLTRLDENTYTDDKFVTKVEYQVFIDATCEQGKYHQPHHWDTEAYQIGEGKTPIVGVTSNDALAFCKWLTQREPDKTWFYRLPRSEDLSQDQHIGYWTETDDGISFKPPYATNDLDEEVIIKKNKYFRKLASTRIRNHARALDRARIRILVSVARQGLHIARISDLDQALDRVQSLDLAYARYLDMELDRARSHTDDLDRILDRALALDLAQSRELVSVLDRDLANIRTRRDLATDFDRTLGIALFFSIVLHVIIESHNKQEHIEHHKVQQLADIADGYLDLFIALVMIEERHKGNLEAFEGIRIVKQRRNP